MEVKEAYRCINRKVTPGLDDCRSVSLTVSWSPLSGVSIESGWAPVGLIGGLSGERFWDRPSPLRLRGWRLGLDGEETPDAGWYSVPLEEQYPCTRLYSVHKPCKQCLNSLCFYSLRRVYVINKEVCVRTVCAHEELLRGGFTSVCVCATVLKHVY
uniref:Uncharacterized protein n=1 Tax=Mola mola TaxID=94237 RepID=A0A3Q3XMX9_MOLML